MKIYDITQELFSSVVFPGDESPAFSKVSEISKGASYNLSTMSLCVHNGTHMDAPSHFIGNGKTIDELDLSKCIGRASVVEASGDITAELIERIAPHSEKRLLFKGDCIITLEAAKALNKCGIELVGVESQSVGDAKAPLAVHVELLSREVVLLEGIRLSDVPVGDYMLFCAPLKLGGLDGAPCRAVLWE